MPVADIDGVAAFEARLGEGAVGPEVVLGLALAAGGSAR